METTEGIESGLEGMVRVLYALAGGAAVLIVLGLAFAFVSLLRKRR